MEIIEIGPVLLSYTKSFRIHICILSLSVCSVCYSFVVVCGEFCDAAAAAASIEDGFVGIEILPSSLRMAAIPFHPQMLDHGAMIARNMVDSLSGEKKMLVVACIIKRLEMSKSWPFRSLRYHESIFSFLSAVWG
jgi:hypothetical protein